MAGGEDLTGDGRPDLLVGAPTYPLIDANLPDGGAYLISLTGGRMDGTHVASQAAITLFDGRVDDRDRRVGVSVAAGDVTGDGTADVIMDAGEEIWETGALIVVPGPVLSGVHPLDKIPKLTIGLGEPWSDDTDEHTLLVGDVDGDEAPDLFVGSPGARDVVPGQGYGVALLVTQAINSDADLANLASLRVNKGETQTASETTEQGHGRTHHVEDHYRSEAAA